MSQSKLNFLRVFLALGLFGFLSPVRSNGADPEKLIKSKLRPTADQVWAAVKAHKGENPFRHTEEDPWKSQMDHKRGLKEQLPNILVQLERVFPDATFVGLGRDCAFLVDAINGYFLTKKQKGRAIRLDASSPTIPRDVDTAEEWLKTIGLDLRPRAVKRMKPMVFFDGTRWLEHSQLRNLLRLIYRAYIKNGGNPKDLLGKIEGLGVAADAGYYSDNPIETLDEKFFKDQNRLEARGGLNSIATLEGWDLTHGYEWHGSFGPLEKTKGGKLQGRPGYESRHTTRESSLHEVAKTLLYLNSHSFQKRLDKARKGLRHGR